MYVSVRELLPVVLACLVLVSPYGGESCLQNLPEFMDQGRGGSIPRIQSGATGTLVVIPDYYFSCTGRVTQWGAYVEPSGPDEMYTLDFQVYRNSSVGGSCYDLVGENFFDPMSPGMGSGGLLLLSVPEEEQFLVRPGDIVGFFVLDERGVDSRGDRRDSSRGVELYGGVDVEDGGLIVYTQTDISSSSATTCRVDLQDFTSTNGGPVITAVVETITVSPPTPSPPGQPTLAATETPSQSESSPTLMSTPAPSVTPSNFLFTTPVPSSSSPSLGPEGTGGGGSGVPSSSSPSPSLVTGPPTTGGGGGSSGDAAIIAIIVVVLGVFIILLALAIVILVIIRLRSTMSKRGMTPLPVGTVDNPNYGEPTLKNLSLLLKPPAKVKQPNTVGLYSTQQEGTFSDHDYQSVHETSYTKSAEYAYPTIQPKPANGVPPSDSQYAYVDSSAIERRQKDSQTRHVYHTVEPEQVYAATNRVPSPRAANTHHYHTLETQPSEGQYADPTVPSYMTEMYADPTVFDSAGIYVPTEEQRLAAGNHYEMLETNQYNKLKFFMDDQTYWAPACTACGLYSQLAEKKYREIQRYQIQILEPLGSGQFGDVCRGRWKLSGESLEVAVKSLKKGVSEAEKVKFLQEAAIMGQFGHPNTVRLYGMITMGEPAMIVLEFMPNGDLRSYLRSLDLVRCPDQTELQRQFVRFAREIAAGMAYLSRKSFVHRDLAARNILLDQNMTCKIGDFGMARDLMDDTYYKSKGGKVPVKWTAPEALLFKKYSTASDVWSFGMVLFEIWSVGQKPFQKLTNTDVIALVPTGHCQPPPSGCPRAIYALMVDCWNPFKEERISFGDVSRYLKQPEEDLLFWAEEVASVSATAHILGADQKDARNLYLDLQHKYK